MEEDIEILENILKTKEYGLCEITDTFYKAIENLIKGYRELEEENKKWEEWAENAEYDMSVNYIPKSKVKEKIEELNNYDSEFCQRVINHNEHTLTEFVQNILQELMEDK